ncbi:hypothetical protein LSAT2_031773 [Lamellibrachia satsuma]|nr:hypothetical protein LSAT2_031773 [Lamellibrachia satsuma]
MPTCSFFRIPTEPTLLTKWLAQINRANFKPTKHSRLCSAHFEKSCFGRDPKKMAALGWVGAKVSLKQDAVPTIFPLVEAVLVPPTIRRKRASTTTSLGLGTKSDSKASWSRKQSATASATVSTPPVDSRPTGTATAPSTSTTNRKRQRVKVTSLTDELAKVQQKKYRNTLDNINDGEEKVNRHVTAMMETEDKEDITAEIHHQVSDAAREEQQSDNKERILPFKSTNQAETWSENVGEPLIKVKLEKDESEDCSSYSGETRHWVVCENEAEQCPMKNRLKRRAIDVRSKEPEQSLPKAQSRNLRNLALMMNSTRFMSVPSPAIRY